jgi:oligoribonuclease NrnB/cAMP/cGMP phosphodiesterase (DHH superfamily)
MLHLCLFHKDCFDGLMAAYIYKLYHEDGRRHRPSHDDEFVFMPMNYHDPIEPVIERIEQRKNRAAGWMSTLATIHILDFSFKSSVLRQLVTTGLGVTNTVVLDHHPVTATIKTECEEWIPERKWDLKIFHDPSMSGAMMTWKHFFKDQPAPAIVQYVSDWDTYQLKLPFTREIIQALGSYELELSTWSKLFQTHGMDRELITHLFGMVDVVSRVHSNAINWAIKHTLRMVVVDVPLRSGLNEMELVRATVPVINCPHYLATDALTKLCEMYPDAPFAMGYYDMDGLRKFSVRSTSMDVRPFVQQFGGNGHERAAGFTVSTKSNHPLIRI